MSKDVSYTSSIPVHCNMHWDVFPSPLQYMLLLIGVYLFDAVATVIYVLHVTAILGYWVFNMSVPLPT